MAYQITFYVSSTPFPAPNNWLFYPAGSTYNMTSYGITESFSIPFDDPDGEFDNSYYHLDPDQALTEDRFFASEFVPAGTIVTAYNVTLLRDSAGNIYHVFMPLEGTTEGVRPSNYLGDQYVLAVIPSTVDTPPFDPNGTYTAIELTGAYPARPLIPTESVAAPCFASSTMMLTDRGPRPIEELRVGDRVSTRDNGWQDIRWIGERHVSAHRLDVCPNLRPIRIKAGSLGPNCPARDLVVSPQHRVLVESKIAARLFDETEVFVAAKHLTSLDGVSAFAPKSGVTYHHMLLGAHGVVDSEGCWTESLYPGPVAQRGLGREARREIDMLFPELRSGIPPEGARKFITGKQGRELLRRHLKHDRPLVMA